MPETVLEVDGVRYGGWTKIAIQRGLEQIAGQFELAVTERWPGAGVSRPIRPGQSCRVLVEGNPVITGYVDDVRPSFSAAERAIEVTGRDRTGDLVDCAAVWKSGSWSNATLARIAADLCRPFGIDVVDQVGVGKRFTTFALQEGETAFEALERAARMRGVLLVADGAGRLAIARAAAKRAGTALVQGKNLLTGRGHFSWRERFSKYTVKGQAQGTDTAFGAAAASQKGEASDAGVTRYRPLVVLAEDQGEGASFAERASWERNVRRGRSSRATVTVQGWQHAGGIWAPNLLVPVESSLLGIDAELLTASVTLTLDERGTTAELELCAAEAFDVIAPPKKKKGAGEVWQ